MFKKVVLCLVVAVIIFTGFKAAPWILADEGCISIVGDEIFTSAEGDYDSYFYTTCEDEWVLENPPGDLVFVPRGDWYALTTNQVGHERWIRIREGAEIGAYFSWNFLARINCDRKIEEREVSWIRPIFLLIEPTEGQITCLIEVVRDLDSSLTWFEQEMEMDPYDSSLRGPDGQRQGETLVWMLTGQALVKREGEPNFLLDIEACTDCEAPTSLYEEIEGDEEIPPHVKVMDIFPRDSDEILSWTITVQVGQQFGLWEGIQREALQ